MWLAGLVLGFWNHTAKAQTKSDHDRFLEVTTFGRATNGMQMGFFAFPSGHGHGVVVQTLDPTNQGKELLSLSLQHYGIISATNGFGRAARPRYAFAFDRRNYPPVVGGQWKSPKASDMDWTFPTSDRKHSVIPLSTNHPSVITGPSLYSQLIFPVKDTYTVTYWPIFYMAEREFKSTDQKPPRFVRIEFPPISFKFNAKIAESGR